MANNLINANQYAKLATANLVGVELLCWTGEKGETKKNHQSISKWIHAYIIWVALFVCLFEWRVHRKKKYLNILSRLEVFCNRLLDLLFVRTK